jgi:3-oxoacyl-[acyl-carrier protein] reductase
MKTVLITGASRGIGCACAKEFDKLGYNVAVHYNRSEDAARELCKSLKSAEIYKADVSSSEQVNAIVRKATADFGHIDVVVNNAGVALSGLFTDATDDEIARLCGVDLCGAMYVSRAVLPQMINRKSGKIINISSIWGMCGASCEVIYSAVKAGIIGFTKALAKEVGPSGITVNCIAPGVIETDMTKSLGEETLSSLAEDTPLERNGTPQDIANAICFLASDKADFITGQVLSPNGGFII